MDNYEHLDEFQLSVLTEIGNIGAGNAATALADILADRIMMSVPDLKVVEVSSMATILGGPENEVAGILLGMTGDVEGVLLFLLDRPFVGMLIKALLPDESSEFGTISEMSLSAIMEIGNILAGSYVNAIAALTNLDIRLTIPQACLDMVGAILSYPAALFGEMGDKLLLIEEDFVSGESAVKSHILIMPELRSLEKILGSLGVG